MALQIATETADTLTRRLRLKGGLINTKKTMLDLVTALAGENVNSADAGDGAADMDALVFSLTTSVDLTGFSPKRIGQVALIYCYSSGTPPTLKCGAGCTFDGTNNTATFTANSALILVASTLTRWRIITNRSGVARAAVAFSST